MSSYQYNLLTMSQLQYMHCQDFSWISVCIRHATQFVTIVCLDAWNSMYPCGSMIYKLQHKKNQEKKKRKEESSTRSFKIEVCKTKPLLYVDLKLILWLQFWKGVFLTYTLLQLERTKSDAHVIKIQLWNFTNTLHHL